MTVDLKWAWFIKLWFMIRNFYVCFRSATMKSTFFDICDGFWNLDFCQKETI